jgi:hypothetical protein
MSHREFETTLTADYYRRQAHVCNTLADASQTAKPLFARLYVLAQQYTAKAASAESKAATNGAVPFPPAAQRKLESHPTFQVP